MSILMIRPIRFGYNAQTAVNNAFQEQGEDPLAVQQAAVQRRIAFSSQ